MSFNFKNTINVILLTNKLCMHFLKQQFPRIRDNDSLCFNVSVYDFHCLGSWEDDTGNMWAAILDRGEDEERFRYRCMVSSKLLQYILRCGSARTYSTSSKVMSILKLESHFALFYRSKFRNC